MSLILEALRKSEAERQRGRTPDLFAMPAREPLMHATPRPHPTAPWLVVAALVVAAGIAWTFRPQPSTPASVAADATPLPGGAEAIESSVDPLLRAPTRTATSVPGPTLSAAPVPPPAQHGNPPPPVTSQQTPASSAPATVTAPDIPARASVDAAARALAATAARTAVPEPAVEVPVEPVPVRASADGSIALAELGAGERQQLPPLRMSMHLWAPESTRRFVIVDGTRLSEGDRVGNAVVESITADGAVLAWQGRRIRLQMH